MTEDTLPQTQTGNDAGKRPVGFWWIAMGIILLICGAAVVISVLPWLLASPVFNSSSHHGSPVLVIFGPLLPGLFALAYGLDLRRKAGLLKFRGILPGISDDHEKK
jgi:hypothetical protein